MEVEFDTRVKHLWSMIVSGPSSSGKTVFTKQVMNRSDKQFEQIYTDTKIARGLALFPAIPSSLDAIPIIKRAQSHGV